MQKNYYLILGVRSDATLEEIKSAFRRRAMELHPDHSGMESGPFMEVQEAYGVLSDPERRRSYDRQGEPTIVRRAPWGPVPEPLTKKRCSQAKPFAQEGRGRGVREFSIRESFDVFRPSFDELFDRIWSNFEDWPQPKSERFESLTVEIVVSPADAMNGGSVRLLIPGLATCPTCGGRGAVGDYECWRCDGEGSLAVNYPVDVEYPPNIRDGHAIRISLSRYGIENFFLTVLFRVGEKKV